jgi:hypothetical protein
MRPYDSPLERLKSSSTNRLEESEIPKVVGQVTISCKFCLTHLLLLPVIIAIIAIIPYAANMILLSVEFRCGT